VSLFAVCGWRVLPVGHFCSWDSNCIAVLIEPYFGGRSLEKQRRKR